MFTKDELILLNSILNIQIRETKAQLRRLNFSLDVDGDQMQTKTLIEVTRAIRANEDLLNAYEKMRSTSSEYLHNQQIEN